MNYFLSLISLGLWRDVPESVQRIKNDIDNEKRLDWNSVVRMAEFQSVTGLLYIGKSQLGPLNEIEKEGLLNTYGLLLYDNRKINNVLGVVVRKLENYGIPYCLLKGQGVGCYYEDPESRAGGDIDLYVGKYQRDAIEVLKSLSDDGITNHGKHVNLQIYGVEIELHKYVDSMIRNSMNTAFWKWSEEELFRNAQTKKIADIHVRIPDSTFNVFCIFYHLFRHYLISGVGLRQLCDWERVLYVERNSIDRKQLCKRLNEFKISEGWDAFMTIAVIYMYLPIESAIYCKGKCSSNKSEKILRQILHDGNFGVGIDNGRRPTEKMAIKWYNMKRIIRRSLTIYTIFPRIVTTRVINYLSPLRFLYKT